MYKEITKIRLERLFENETIVITDPCYVHFKGTEKDVFWETFIDNYCGEGSSAKNVPLNDNDSVMTSNTIYGDWSCNTYEGSLEDYITDWSLCRRNEKYSLIGTFCADAGLVSVIPERLIEKQTGFHITRIENFSGKVSFVEVTSFDDDGNYIDKELCVWGVGSVNFFTVQ